MADEIVALFRKFLSSIRPDDDYLNTLRNRREVIVRAVNREFRSRDTSDHAIYVGSHGRNTANKYSDIDLAVILPEQEKARFTNYSGNGQSTLLQVVKGAILDSYPTTDVKGDGQIVSVKFSDGMTFEVLPAFETGYYINSLYYPDTHSGGKWKITDPRSEQKAISDLNGRCGDRIYDLCRTVRIWNRQNAANMSGYVIDATVCEFFRCNQSIWTVLDYPHLVSAYVHFLYNNRYKTHWPMVDSNELVIADIDRKAVEDTIKMIDLADASIREGRTWDAIQAWGNILGSSFPVV